MTAKLYKSFFTNASHTEFFFSRFFRFFTVFFVTFFKLRASINRLRLTTKQNQVDVQFFFQAVRPPKLSHQYYFVHSKSFCNYILQQLDVYHLYFRIFLFVWMGLMKGQQISKQNGQAATSSKKCKKRSLRIIS